MIFDSFLAPLNTIKYPKVLKETIDHLKTIKFNEMEVGKYEIKGKDIFFMLSEYESYDKSERIIEAHKEYVDIQFVVKGEEKIGYGVFSPNNILKTEYNETKDLLVYDKLESESELVLIPGVFAVFFTEEPHRPCCKNNEKMKVKKVVVKIRKSLLV
ncbi:MAG: YhcH/YjgK/YiaL family protein [Fusobacteriaceae bacterium]